MSIPFRVQCLCGFESNVVFEGMTHEKPQVFKVPVFLQSTGQLTAIRFREADIGLKDDALFEWIQKHGEEKIRVELGDNAVGLGFRSMGQSEPLHCPKCGNMTAKFVQAGF
jgi:hypothetical protein